jgi:GTPase SAR1 family protein
LVAIWSTGSGVERRGHIRLWTSETNEPKTLIWSGRGKPVQLSVSASPDGAQLASSSYDHCLWDIETGELKTVETRGGGLYDAQWSPQINSGLVAAASSRAVVLIIDPKENRVRVQLEGHTDPVVCVSFSPDGSVLASYAGDIRFWDCETWKPLGVVPDSGGSHIAFNPHLPLLARGGPGSFWAGRAAEDLTIWEIDLELLKGMAGSYARTRVAVQHTTAKVVLVGDSGVGKTGLGWRLAHSEFKEHSSTHGQQFWILDQLSTHRVDGTQCEAILWDLAGQPDYRLIHALFIDDADLAIVLFDPTDSREPLHGVDFWLRQLSIEHQGDSATATDRQGDPAAPCPMILVGARTDRGEARLTQDDLDAFCRKRGISGGYLPTSAKEGSGLPQLIEKMKKLVPWDRKTTAVTTLTFKRIKDYVLELKENRRRKKVLVTPQDLRKRLQKTDAKWKFGDEEMITAVRHLGNYGYVRVLLTSKGEHRILLIPELLNNLAASLILEARRNQKGLGSLEEAKLLRGDYRLRELEGISTEEARSLARFCHSSIPEA